MYLRRIEVILGKKDFDRNVAFTVDLTEFNLNDTKALLMT